MNCIYCGKSIDEHDMGRETDICVGRALGTSYEPTSYDEYPTPFTDRMAWAGACVSHLAADDNPVEHVTIGWDRSDSKWYIGFEGWYPLESDKPSGYYSVTADTLPLALCRAVLTLEAAEAER